MLRLRIGILVVFAFALGTFARGQGPPSPQSRNPRPDAVQREVQRQFEMQAIEKALTNEPSRQVQRYAPLVLEQIRADFLRIQVVDRGLTRAISVPGTLDLKFVARSAEEIRKRSRRLKSNLALPAPKTVQVNRAGIAVEAKIEPLRSSVSTLSHLIDEFVSNPMFERARLIDPQLSAKALQDIEAIIELSGEIKRSSEKLKATWKPQ